MKKKEERKKWKGLKNGFLLGGFIALLISQFANCSCRGNQLAEGGGDS